MGTAASVATPPAASLPDLTAASPALAEFFKETKTYSRIHVHLIGARKAPENGETATKKSKGGFGLGWLSAAVDRDKVSRRALTSVWGGGGANCDTNPYVTLSLFYYSRRPTRTAS